MSTGRDGTMLGRTTTGPGEDGRQAMYARVTWLEGSPAQAHEAIEGIRKQALPAIERAPGFGELFLLLDREHGRAMAITTWETKEDLDASEELARRLRSLPLARWSSSGTERYEVAIRRGAGATAGMQGGADDGG